MAVRKSRVLNPVLGPDARICWWNILIYMHRLTKFSVNGGTTLQSPVYNLLPVDLRTPPNQSIGPLLSPLFSPNLPTLLLFECVLAYMISEDSNALIRWFAEYITGGALGAIVYEMFGLEDSFGRVMMNNLRVRRSSSIESRTVLLNSDVYGCHSRAM